MLRITLVIAVFALVACGSGETTQTSAGTGTQSQAAAGSQSGTGDTPPVSAPAPSQPAASTAAATNPVVESCLGLVRQTEYEKALPVCLEALKVDPNNAEVQAAVDKARSEVASLDAAKDAAAGAASDKASGAIDDAAGSAKSSIPKMPGSE